MTDQTSNEFAEWERGKLAEIERRRNGFTGPSDVAGSVVNSPGGTGKTSTTGSTEMRRLMDFATNGMRAQEAIDAVIAEATPPAEPAGMQRLMQHYRDGIVAQGATGPTLEEFEEYDVGGPLGIVLAPAADDEAFWRLVAYDAEHRSLAYGLPVPVDLTEVKRSHDGWTRYGAAVLAWAQAHVQSPEWGWWIWGVDDAVSPESVAEGSPGAFYGALIRPKPAGEEQHDRPHIRIRYATNGAHTYCSVWSVERGGAKATHGRNGTLVFRNAEFDVFRQLIESGVDYAQDLATMGLPAPGVIEFVEDPEQYKVDPAHREG